MWRADQVPYLFTLIIAVLGWLVTRAVDEVDKSPMITYHIENGMRDGMRTCTAHLHNISADKVFRNLLIALVYPKEKMEGANFKTVEFRYPAPAMRQDQNRPREYTDKWMAQSVISELQPGATIDLITTLEGQEEPSVHCQSAEAVRLVRRSAFTDAVEHEPALLLGLAVVLTVFLCIYLFVALRKSP